MFYEGITSENENDVSKNQIESFKNNLNSNCNSLLKEEFSDKDFKSNVECEIDLREHDI